MKLRDKLLSSANYKLDWIPTHKPTTPKEEKPKMKRAQTKVTQAERFAIMKLLEKFVVKGEDGYVFYTDNMSDFKIAQAVGPHIPATSVGYTRIQLHGKLREQHPPKPEPAIPENYVRIQKALVEQADYARNLHDRLTIVERRVARLANELGVDLTDIT